MSYVAVATAAAAAINIGIGIHKEHKRNKEIKATKSNIDKLVQPMYQIPSLYGDNLGLAEQNASQGFSQDSLNAFTQNNNQLFASATDSILQNGGSINDIGKLYGQADTAELGLIAQDETLRDRHLEQLYERRQEMAGQQGTLWRLNYYNRWKDKAAANAMLLQGALGMPTGEAEVKSGITGLANAGAQAYDSGAFSGGGNKGGGVGTGAGSNADFGGAGFGNDGQTSGWM